MQIMPRAELVVQYRQIWTTGLTSPVKFQELLDSLFSTQEPLALHWGPSTKDGDRSRSS